VQTAHKSLPAALHKVEYYRNLCAYTNLKVYTGKNISYCFFFLSFVILFGEWDISFLICKYLKEVVEIPVFIMNADCPFLSCRSFVKVL